MTGFKRELKNSKCPTYGEYVGEYVIISTSNGNSEAGKLMGFIDGYALLNPFMGSDYTSGKGLVKKFVKDTTFVNMQPHFSVVPTTKKNLEAYCKFQNEEYQREREVKEAERVKTLSKESDN